MPPMSSKRSNRGSLSKGIEKSFAWFLVLTVGRFSQQPSERWIIHRPANREEVDIYHKRARMTDCDPRDTPSLGRPFDEPKLSTRPVFKIPPRLPILPPLSAKELVAREALRRRGWPICPSPESRSSHGGLPEYGVLPTDYRDVEGSVSRFSSISQAQLLKATGTPIELSDGQESSDESDDEGSRDRSKENDVSDTTGESDLLTPLDLTADS
ncbi:MAG: hypothetical protein Q9207_004251 [Kuettlingeria erythrocarpa]